MNWDLLGHDWAVDLLTAQIENEELRHAYLFTGPSGVGRRTLALRLAQALNCPTPKGVGIPCRTCRICRQIENMQQADLFVVQAERKGGVLKVEPIRDLQHSLSLHPFEARYKIALLLRFEEANLSAMNALLKTLEEPAPQVILLVTANSMENLLPTIVSRCEVLRLRPLSFEHLSVGLHSRMNMPEDQAQLYAHISGGRPGLALRLAENQALLEERIEMLDLLFNLLSANTGERFKQAESLSRDKDKLREMLITWLSFWRDTLLQAAGSSAPVTNLDFRSNMRQVANLLDIQAAGRITGSVERSIDLLDRNVNPRLIVEVLMLDFPLVNFQTTPA